MHVSKPSHYSMNLLLLLLVTISLNLKTSSADEIRPDYSTNPELIISQIKSRGADAVVRELDENKSGWFHILNQIAAGSEAWLKVSAWLRKGTDAGTTTMLQDAVNSALIKAPENVFSITVPPFKIWEICGRSVPLSTYEESIEDLENQIKAVHSVSNPQLVEKRDACLKELEDTRPHLRRFFGIE